MKIKIAFLILATTLLSARASAIGFTFLQSGFAEGATVSGAFFGEDINNDGFLIGVGGDPASEIVFFTAFWSGNSSAPAFSVATTDFWAMVYELGESGGFLGDNPAEFIFAIGGGGYSAGPIGGGIYTDGEDPTGFTQELVVVTPIDESPRTVDESGSAVALLSFGLLTLVFAKRRRS